VSSQKVKIDLISFAHRPDIVYMIYAMLNGMAKCVHEGWAGLRQVDKEAEPVVLQKDGLFYPLHGGYKIAELYCRRVSKEFMEVKTEGSPFSVEEFNIPDDFYEVWATREAVVETLMPMNPDIHSGDPNIRFSDHGLAYHAIPEIGLRGYRVCSDRLNTYDTEFTGKKVLDIGSNMGMIAIDCRRRGASAAHGIETSRGYIDVSNILKSFFKLEYVEFYHTSWQAYHKKTKEKYDIIFALAVHNWMGKKITGFLRDCKKLLNPGGVVLFESHRNQAKNDLVRAISHSGLHPKLLREFEKKRFVFKCIA